MLNVNKVLIQLNIAIELANSKLPQERGLAVVLIDNIIEVQLYKKVVSTFDFDQTTWYGGKRYFDKQKREKALKLYTELLRVAKECHIITDQQLQVLKYAHEIRNTIYHTDNSNEQSIDLALALYYSVIIQNRAILKATGIIAFTNLSGYEKIDFGQGLDQGNSVFLDHENYFTRAHDYLLSKLTIEKKFSHLATQYLAKQLSDLENQIAFITEESKKFNFYSAMGIYWYLNTIFSDKELKKIKTRDLDSILMCALFIRLHEEELNDIEDTVTRQRQGNRLYRQLRVKYKGVYPFKIDLSGIQRRVNNIPKDLHRAVGSLIQLENDILNFKRDVGFAAMMLDGYMMSEFDRVRGK